MDERVRIGGLMRCCLQTLEEVRSVATEPAHEGQWLLCKWCESPMMFRNGAWEWLQEEKTYGTRDD